MTIGDVLAVGGMITATGGTLWATLMAQSLLFPEKASRARAVLVTQPKKAIGLGALLIATLGAIGFVFIVGVKGGMLGLLGWLMLVALFAIASLGSAGLALELGERVQKMDGNRSLLDATGRGALLLILAGFLPVLGWLGFFPASLAASLGAGFIAIFEKKAAILSDAVSSEPAPEGYAG